MIWHDIISHDTSCDVLDVFVGFKPMICDCFSQCWQSSEIASLHKMIPHQNLTHAWKDMILRCWKFNTSQMYKACMHFWNAPLSNQAKSAQMRLKPINCLSANVWKLLNQSLTKKVTLFPLDKRWPPFCRRYFHKNIREWKFCILIKISLKSVPKGLINKNPALV